MAFLIKEEVSIAGAMYMVKERIAEGGFGFVDLVVNPNTQQLYVVCDIITNNNK